MFNRFARDARQVVRCAEREASQLGSPTVEAEHLLLALTWADETTMTAAGLDRDAVALALEAERNRSLIAVGIVAGDFELPRRIVDQPRLAASAKLALERAVKAAAACKDRRIVAAHILLGVLQAEAGTVPRALEHAGVDRAELRERTSALLGEWRGR